jgi:hypothetical protein
MSLALLIDFLAHEDRVYATYGSLVSLKQQADSPFERVRNVVEARLFPGYGHKLIFGVLSLTGRGLRQFGEVSVTLNEDYIAHRSTVLESGGFSFLNRFLAAEDFPRGFICTWSQRHKLAVAKLGGRITARTETSEFPALIQHDIPEEPDEHMEVQVYGSFNYKSIAAIRIDCDRGDAYQRQIWLAASELAKQRGIPLINAEDRISA